MGEVIAGRVERVENGAIVVDLFGKASAIADVNEPREVPIIIHEAEGLPVEPEAAGGDPAAPEAPSEPTAAEAPAPIHTREGRIMAAETRIYSCDDHLDLFAVPPGLWESRLPRAQAERGLRVVEMDGNPFWVCEDQVLFPSGNSGNPELKKLSAIGRAGIEDDGFRAGNPKLRLQDMDRDNLWASVIYGPTCGSRRTRKMRI